MSICAITTGDQNCQAEIKWLRQCFVLEPKRHGICFFEFVFKVTKGYLNSIEIYTPYTVIELKDRTISLFDDRNDACYSEGYKVLSIDPITKKNGEILFCDVKAKVREIKIINVSKVNKFYKINICFAKNIVKNETVAVRLEYINNNICTKIDDNQFAVDLRYYDRQDYSFVPFYNLINIDTFYLSLVFPQNATSINDYYPDVFQRRLLESVDYDKMEAFYGSRTREIWSQLPRKIMMWHNEMENNNPAIKPWSGLHYYCEFETKLSESDRNISEQSSEPAAKKEYDIWTAKGKYEATEKEINDYKDNLLLFVDADKCLVYSKGNPINNIENSPQSYNILEVIMEKKGCATFKDIFKIIYPDSTVKKISHMKNDVVGPVHRLRDKLIEFKIILCSLRGNAYCLDKEIDFVLIRKKKDD